MLPKIILFSTDFSENSRPPREYALDFAGVLGAELAILHVIDSSNLGYPSLHGVPVDIRAALETIQGSVDRALGLIATDCCRHLPSVTTHSRIGLPAHEIVRFAQEKSVGLIVVGTHGWTGFKHLIMGSTAENVLRTASCPVLTVRSWSGRG